MSSRIVAREDALAVQAVSWPSAQFAPEEPDETDPERASSPPPAAVNAEEIWAECGQRIEAASKKSYQEGLAAGRQERAAEYESALGNVAQSVLQLAQWKPKLRRQAEQDLVRLALAIGRRVVHRELQVDPGALAGIVEMALQQLQQREVFSLRVHPDDSAAIQKAAARIGLILPTLQSDPGLSRGSAIFETAQGQLDASLDTQLDEIERGLYDRLEA